MNKKNQEQQEVFVLRKHIVKGKQKSCSSCAIALALKDHFKDANWVQVYNGHNILIDNKIFSIRLLDRLVINQFITNYDKNKSKVMPFSFLVFVAKKPVKV